MFRVGVLSALAGLAAGAWLGYSLADGQCAKRELAETKSDVQQVETRAEGLRKELVVRSERGAEAARRTAVARAAAREVIREAETLPPRSECEWTPAEQRVLHDLYGAYFGAAASPGRLPDAVSKPAGTAPTAAPVGAGDSGVGTRVQDAARQLQGEF